MKHKSQSVAQAGEMITRILWYQAEPLKGRSCHIISETLSSQNCIRNTNNELKKRRPLTWWYHKLHEVNKCRHNKEDQKSDSHQGKDFFSKYPFCRHRVFGCILCLWCVVFCSQNPLRELICRIRREPLHEIKYSNSQHNCREDNQPLLPRYSSKRLQKIQPEQQSSSPSCGGVDLGTVRGNGSSRQGGLFMGNYSKLKRMLIGRLRPCT